MDGNERGCGIDCTCFPVRTLSPLPTATRQGLDYGGAGTGPLGVAREGGFSFLGGGVDRALRPDPPPKRGSIDGTPKIPQKPTRGRPWFQWRWYLCLRTQGPRLIPATCM